MSETSSHGSPCQVELAEVSTTDDDGISNALAQFDHVDAHCYDPNEEQRLRSVIEVVGGDEFNMRIHTLADQLGSSNVKPQISSSSLGSWTPASFHK